MIMYIRQKGLSPYGLGTSTGQWRGRATCCWTGWTPPSLQHRWSSPSMAPSSPWSSSSPSIITSSPQINTDQVLVSQVETQPTGRRSWSEVCSCRPPGARSYDSNISILKVLLINNQHDMCRELDLFVNRFPVLLSIFSVETETCALGDLSPVLLSPKASSSSHNRLIKVNMIISAPFLSFEQTSVNHIQNLSFYLWCSGRQPKLWWHELVKPEVKSAQKS